MPTSTIHASDDPVIGFGVEVLPADCVGWRFGMGLLDRGRYLAFTSGDRQLKPPIENDENEDALPTFEWRDILAAFLEIGVLLGKDRNLLVGASGSYWIARQDWTVALQLACSCRCWTTTEAVVLTA